MRTREQEAEEAWHACGALEFHGERLYWSGAHDRLYRILHHASRIDPQGMASIFLWVATQTGAEVMKSLREWFADIDRTIMLEKACMLDVAETYKEINEVSAKLFDHVDASRSKAVPSGEGVAPPGK